MSINSLRLQKSYLLDWDMTFANSLKFLKGNSRFSFTISSSIEYSVLSSSRNTGEIIECKIYISPFIPIYLIICISIFSFEVLYAH